MSRVTHLRHITASLLPLTRSKTIHFSPLFALSTVVGFDKVATKPNIFIQLAAQFQDVTTGKLAFDKIFTGLKGVDWDNGGIWRTTAPQVQFYNGKAYDCYYYLNDAWYKDAEGKDAYKPGWSDAAGSYVDLTATPGQGFWFVNPSEEAEEICGAGQVEESSEAVVEVPGGAFAILANIFPMSVNLNDAKHVVADGIVGVDWDNGGVWRDTATQIQLFNGKNYDCYYYLNDGWYKDAEGKESYKPGWCDAAGSIVDAIIPAQQSFWIIARTGKFTFTFKR